jgi:hypothetical protein
MYDFESGVRDRARGERTDSFEEAEAAVGSVDEHFAIIAVPALLAKAVPALFAKAISAIFAKPYKDNAVPDLMSV